MSLICIVCRDPLTVNPEPPQEDTTNEYQAAAAVSAVAGGISLDTLPEIVVTRCGHTYHEYCLHTWFNRIPRKECPYCKSSVKMSECQKIFAVGDEDSDEILATIGSSVKARQAEMVTLRSEHEQVHTFLADCKKNLDAEQLAHDCLKFEFASLESEIQKLESEKEIQRLIHLSVVESKNSEFDEERNGLQAQIQLLESEIEKHRESLKTSTEQEIRKALTCISDAHKLLNPLINTVLTPHSTEVETDSNTESNGSGLEWWHENSASDDGININENEEDFSAGDTFIAHKDKGAGRCEAPQLAVALKHKAVVKNGMNATHLN